MLHIEVTPTSLDRALAFMNMLLRELERLEIQTLVDRQKKCTNIIVEGKHIKLTLTEHVKRTDHEITDSEKKAQERYLSRIRIDSSSPYPRIPRHDYHPTGDFTLTAGQWPARTWRDTKRTRLEQRLGEIVAGILLLAEEIRVQDEERARKTEARRLAEEDYAFRKQRLEDERTKFQQLESQANDLERARRLRAYADAAEAAARDAGNLSKERQDWLAWARAKADWLDPLIAVSDVILDAPEPKKPGLWW
ncbi:MAG: hypothetical protein DI564_09585 [Rhodanobacter denitrificans]|uniref:Uncharacterized protein n=1 Tax=Rhodanobacter denitrificans TaxID=666685 RepID=A0A2W5KC97_9GAMM|nr:MAG: hypothetical protein DI564_09585 [Rhodanobacter denitrificans]